MSISEFELIEMEQASANLSSSLEKAKGANAGDKMLRIAKKGSELSATMYPFTSLTQALRFRQGSTTVPR